MSLAQKSESDMVTCVRHVPSAQTHSLDVSALGTVSDLDAPAMHDAKSASATTPDARRALEDSLRASGEHEEHVGNVMRMRKAAHIAMVLWPPFFLIDIAMHRFAFPGSSLTFQALARSLSWLVLLWTSRRLARTPAPSRRQLIAIDALVFGSACFGVSLSCLSFGDLDSQYAAGIPLVFTFRAAFVQVPWRMSLVPAVVSALSYPIVQLAPMLWSEAAFAQLRDPAAVTIFCGHCLQILTTFCVVLAGSHAVWALRRQIYAARNIDRYRLVRALGRGGMGEVWLAHHGSLRRDVALKMLRPDRLHDPVAQRRFEREVCAMMRLTHANTVRVFDYGVTEDGLMYYAMELLHGQDLGQLVLQRGALCSETAVHVLRQVCAAVGEAHALGIVHRDLKPENIFICPSPTDPTSVKVLDFGIAKNTNAESESALTQFERALGTPQYMSPEVVVGKPADERSDVYALGAVLYFMLAGEPPFHGRTSTAVMIAHSQEQPVLPSAKCEVAIPAELEEIVMRCLKKAPAERYADAAELECALARLTVL